MTPRGRKNRSRISASGSSRSSRRRDALVCLGVATICITSFLGSEKGDKGERTAPEPPERRTSAMRRARNKIHASGWRRARQGHLPHLCGGVSTCMCHSPCQWVHRAYRENLG